MGVVWVAPRPWKMLKSELIAAAARCSIRSRSVVDGLLDESEDEWTSLRTRYRCCVTRGTCGSRLLLERSRWKPPRAKM